MPNFTLVLLGTPTPYHILTYGTLFGTQIFQSFILGPTAFSVLPREHFRTLQTQLFKVYFGLQTFLPLALAVTYPRGGIMGLYNTEESGIMGPAAAWCIGTWTVMGALNFWLVGPAVTQTMYDRMAREEKEGKKYTDPGPKSGEMQALNQKFGRLHGASNLINLMAVVAGACYGVVMAGEL